MKKRTKHRLSKAAADQASLAEKPRDCFCCKGDTLLNENEDGCYVQCPYCGIQGPIDANAEDAVKSWNAIVARYLGHFPDGVSITVEPLSLRAAADTLAGLIPEGMQVIVTGKGKH